MSEIILIFAASIGLTHIIVDSKIFEPIRKLADEKLPEKISYMISCYQCSGFWAAAFLALLVYGFDFTKIILFATAGSFLANWFAIYFNYLEAKSIVNISE